MKKIITMMLLFASVASFAQKAVATKVGQLVSQNADFKRVSMLTVSDGIANDQNRTAVEKATYAKLNTQELTHLMAAKHEYIELEIPYLGQTIKTQLYKVNPFANGFHADTDQAKNVTYEPGIYYRGIIKGDQNSVVSFSFFKGEFGGFISGKNLQNLVIGKLDKANNTSDYIVYSDRDLKLLNHFSCQTKDVLQEGQTISNRNPEGVAPKCVTMYMEMDYNLYQANGSSVTNTNNWATLVFNEVQTLYENDLITVSLKSTYVWTTDDPYEGESSSDYLYQFNDLRPAFDGDLGQLVGIDPGGLGGVAVTIDGLCAQNNFSYSDVNFSYQEVPTYSWTIMVITHEFGHLIGSPHTHACVWNGNNTAIDNCGPYALGEDWEGAECTDFNAPIIPSQAEGGTIMSYCHLTDAGINFNNGFGIQPRNQILSAIAGANCLSTDCISTCINAVADVNVAVVGTDATVTWTELGDATSWQVAVTPFASNNPTWTTVGATTYSTSGLNPNTFYKFWVRPICGAGLTAPNDRKVFVTGAAWCSNIQITDTGGTNNEYTNNESYVRVIIPNVANKKIQLTFTEFDLEVDYDYLYVYDGNSTSAPDLSSGGFTGTDIPGPFTSTAADGSLTVRFYADGGVTEEGYVANVSCLNVLGTESFQPNIDFLYYPNPTSGQVTIQSKTPIDAVSVYNVAGQLLYNKKINAMDTKVDIASFATGTYFFKLKFNDKEANFKIVKMN
ncbi:M12 family metallo-peptidase [Flavobacterium sp.]|uniref:M12 family metallo-peptidase n=1 Tax=Flavobacterium sp. TaxID=239 RepID=UPI0039E36EC3